jgi:hypothetical protein
MLWWTLRKLKSARTAKRLEGVRDLRDRSTREVVTALGACLDDRSSEVRAAAFDALSRVGALTLEQAIRLLDDSNAQTRLRAVREVAELRDPAGTTALLRLVESNAGDCDESAAALIKEAFTALDAIDPVWRAGPVGSRLLTSLWGRFAATEYRGAKRSVLPTVNAVEPRWTETPEAARTITPFLLWVGDGLVNAHWERSMLRKLARFHQPLIVAALASDHWAIRRGASFALGDLLYAARPAAMPKNWLSIPAPDAEEVPTAGLVALLIEALRTPRSADAALKFLRVLLRFDAKEIETAHLQTIAALRSVEARRFEDVFRTDGGESFKVGEDEVRCTLDLEPARQLARAELARRGVAT